MRSFGRSKGFSLIEVLATVAILGMLLAAVGAAVSHVLDAELTGAGRQSTYRSADELAARLSEEARSSTAVFVPPTDVLGQPNYGSTGAHEVDIFRKASDSTPTYVAYRFDSTSRTVTRYEYTPSAVGDTILNSDQLADGIASFSAVRTSPSAISSVVGASSIKPVNVYYGSADLEGGNGIVSVQVVAGAAGGPQTQMQIDLSTRAAPTDVAVLVSAGSPPPSPGVIPSPVTVAFIIRHPNIVHGPFSINGPGQEEHGPGIAGSVYFLGNGSGNTETLLELDAKYPIVQSGTYEFQNSEGQDITAVITCGDSACPPFMPRPIPTSGPTIYFQPAQ